MLRFRALRSLSLRSSLSLRRSDLPRDLLRDRLRSFILLLSFFDLSFERDLKLHLKSKIMSNRVVDQLVHRGSGLILLVDYDKCISFFFK